MSAPIFLKSKEEALPDIKNWLLSAFQEKKGCCVPKREVFGAYADFCAQHHYESTTSASFGKFLKKIFPGVETRRLVRNDVQAMYYHNLTQTATECSGSSPPSSPAVVPRPVLTSSTPTSPSTSQLEPEPTYTAHQSASPWSAYYATSRPSLPASPTFRISSCSPPPPPAPAPLPYHFDTYGLLPAPPNAQHHYHHCLPQRQDPIPAAGLSWEGLYYLHSLLAAATQPLPPVLRPKRKTTRKAQKAAGDRPTIDHNLKRKRVEGHEARRVGGSNSESDSGDQDKQQPTVQDEPHDYADPPWTNDHNRRTTTRRTKSRLDYILN